MGKLQFFASKEVAGGTGKINGVMSLNLSSTEKIGKNRLRLFALYVK